MLLPLVSVLHTHDERATPKSTTYPKIFQTSSILGWRLPVPYRKGGRASSALEEQGNPRPVGGIPVVNGRFSPNHAMTPSSACVAGCSCACPTAGNSYLWIAAWWSYLLSVLGASPVEAFGATLARRIGAVTVHLQRRFDSNMAAPRIHPREYLSIGVARCMMARPDWPKPGPRTSVCTP